MFWFTRKAQNIGKVCAGLGKRKCVALLANSFQKIYCLNKLKHMKLFNNWFHPQIHGLIFIFTENEEEVTVLYQMLGSLCFYVIFCSLLIKTLGNLLTCKTNLF